MSSVTNDQLRKLLLKQLPSHEIERLEEAILMEEGVAERLREQEFDLIDDYVEGRLTAADRDDLERHLLNTPERAMSVRVARALAAQRRLTAAQFGSRKRARPWLDARFQIFASLAAGLTAVALIPHWSGHFSQPGGSAPAGAITLPHPAAPTSLPMPAAGAITTLTLLADADRGGSTPLVHLKSGNSAVRLQAEVPEPREAATYSIELDSATGTRLFYATDLAIRGAGAYRFVEVTVPAQALGAGVRTITLRVDGSSAQEPPQYRWQIDSVPEGGQKK